MLTARKAKRKTQRVIKKEQRKVLSRVKGDIQRVIGLGRFSIIDCSGLDLEIKQKLEKLGYIVEPTESKCPSHCYIRWD